MTKGELVTACIKSMFDNNDEFIDPKNVSFVIGDNDEKDFDNARYAERTVNIIESINRGLHRIEASKKLPRLFLTIDINTPRANSDLFYTEYDLMELTDNGLLTIAEILYQDKNGIINNNNLYTLTYMGWGRIRVQTIISSNEKYFVSYDARVKELKYDDMDTMVIPYPDYIINILPYFVKADLYEEDNPSASAYSRELFEQYLMQLPTQEMTIYPKFKNKYDFNSL